MSYDDLDIDQLTARLHDTNKMIQNYFQVIDILIEKAKTISIAIEKKSCIEPDRMTDEGK